MRRSSILILGAALNISSTGDAAEFDFGDQTIHVPDGYTLERIAESPLVDRPINGDFDEFGRLYVTEASGTNDPVEKQARDLPHQVLRLEDDDGDGVFDRRTVFADRLMLPEGALWLDGSLYVSAPPAIWKLTDTNGDGVADRREEWLNPGTLTGCANDLHGPYLGLDGRIYWTKGAFAEQTYETPSGVPFVTRAAHIFRRKVDGGWVEPVMTGGMDNPVEVAFSPSGERFFSTTFLQHPSGGLRDGLIHAVYGGVYGKVHDVIDDGPRTGEILPPMTHMGPAAACALIRYQSKGLGPDSQGALFSSSFNLNKVTRHILQPSGATYTTEDSDFLQSNSRDFHPTDLIEDADGSLIVIDTGAWYKLCCPTSQLHRPDVLGAIYRLRKSDAEIPEDPRGLQLDWGPSQVGRLVERLSDPRFAVRERATRQLANAERSVAGALAHRIRFAEDSETRLNALWAGTRIDHPTLRAIIATALNDPDPTVQLAATHSVALWRDSRAVKALTTQLSAHSPHLRRAAAEALGRIGDSNAVPNLIKATESVADRVEEHSLIYALIQIDEPEITRLGLASPHVSTRRATLLALDQAPSATLTAEEIILFLNSESEVLVETALWIAQRRPEWAASLSGFFEEKLANPSRLTPALAGGISRLATETPIQSGLATSLVAPDASVETQEAILSIIRQAQSYPDSWKLAIANRLSPDSPLLADLLETAASFRGSESRNEQLTSKLIEIAASESVSEDLRFQALAASGAALDLIENPGFFSLTIPRVSRERPLEIRRSAADILSSAKMDGEKLQQLANALPNSTSFVALRTLPAFESTALTATLESLVSNLTSADFFPSISPSQLVDALKNWPETHRRFAGALIDNLEQLKADKAQQLEERLTALVPGDVARGRDIFNSAKAACLTCHEFGYLGGDLGPDLTRIGRIRSRRDLLEALLFPSESLVRAYETHQVTLKTGETYRGILEENSASRIALKLAPQTSVTLEKSTVDSIAPANVSLMPAGIPNILSNQEISDLIAFLEAAK